MYMIITLLLILLIASVYDVIYLKIPNMIIMTGIIIGIYMQYSQYALIGIMRASGGIVIPILLLYPLFLIRALGAADIKLFCVIGAFVTLENLFHIMIGAFLFGAIISLAKMLIQKSIYYRMQFLANYIQKTIKNGQVELYHGKTLDRKSVIPFALPITISVFLKIGGVF